MLSKVATGHVASMRPRRFCRGKLRIYERHDGSSPGFNEAPAILPGKAAEQQIAVRPEGASMRPRRFCRGKHVKGRFMRRSYRASMRPRRFCRGKRHSGRLADMDVPASMRPRRFCRGKWRRPRSERRERHCFNEAPAILPGKAGGRLGPRRGGHRASMRPRRFCRGKARRHRWGRRDVGASMRPRRFCRGKPLHGYQRRWIEDRFNEAPAILPGKAPSAISSGSRRSPLQ